MAQSAANWRNTHTHVDSCIHSHTLHQPSYNHVVRSTSSAIIFQCMLGLRVSVNVIHRTLMWTTGSLTCLRDHSCACVYTWGLGTPTASQHIFDSEKFTNFSCAPDGIRNIVLWILSLTLYQLSHPVPSISRNTCIQHIFIIYIQKHTQSLCFFIVKMDQQIFLVRSAEKRAYNNDLLILIYWHVGQEGKLTIQQKDTMSNKLQIN